MRRKSLHTIQKVWLWMMILLMIGSSSMPVQAQGGQPPSPSLPSGPAVNTCCGYNSSGNPYPCCSGGNCTWWAWREYKNATGISLPSYGNAKDWKNHAQPNGSPPQLGSIVVFQPGVYGASQTYGHVAYVNWVDNPNNPTQFKWTEMGCYSDCGVRTRGPKPVISGVNFIYPPNIPDTTKPLNPTTVAS